MSRPARGALSAVIMAAGGCAPRSIEPQCGWQRIVSVVLSPPSIVLQRGDTARIQASFVRPRSGSGCAPRSFTFVWHSSDTMVVVVDPSGLVQARDTGTASVTVTTSDGPTGTSGVRVRP